MTDYYNLKASEALDHLKTGKGGLSKRDASERLERYGSNEIHNKKKITPLQILARQFTSFIVMIMFAAIVISLLIGKRVDALVMSIIMVLNGLFGFFQE